MPEQSSSEQSIGTRVAIGVAWMALLKISVRLLALVSVTILARLLTPADFGLVAMAMFFYAILDSMAWFGFDSALIHNQQATDEHYNTAFTLNVIFYSIVAALLVALAHVVATSFYNEPRVEPILYVLAAGSFAFGFLNIGTVNFRKDLNYRKDFYFMLSKKWIAFMVTIPCAFYLRSYWALVYGIIAGQIGGVIMSYVLSPYKPRFSLAKFDELFGFSKWLFVNSLLASLRMRIAEPLLGRAFGPEPLGHFNVAYEVSNLPTTELVAPINRAVFPGYAKIAHDMQKIRHGYLAVVSMVALLALPAAAGVAAIADLLIPLWLGDKWRPTIELMKVLAWSGALIALMANFGAVLLALGKPKNLAILNGLYVLVLLILIFPLAARFGPMGAAAAYLLTGLVVNPVKYFFLFRIIGLKWKRFFRAIWRPILASLAMYIIVSQLVHKVFIANAMTGFSALFLAILAGVVSYGLMAGTMWLAVGKPDGAERYLLSRVLPAIRRRLPF